MRMYCFRMEARMALETQTFDIADELGDDEAVTIHLDGALASGDPAYFAHALGKVAKARGMSRIARKPASAAARSMRR